MLKEFQPVRASTSSQIRERNVNDKLQEQNRWKEFPFPGGSFVFLRLPIVVSSTTESLELAASTRECQNWLFSYDKMQ